MAYTKPQQRKKEERSVMERLWNYLNLKSNQLMGMREKCTKHFLLKDETFNEKQT